MTERNAGQAVGLVEVLGLPHAVAVADAMVKAAGVRLTGVEVNTLGAMTVKVTGETGAVRAAFERGDDMAKRLDARVSATLIPRYSTEASVPWIDSPQVVTKLLRSRSSLLPGTGDPEQTALGFLETKGFTGALAGADAMCKAASVRLVALERIGDTRVSMLIRGEVSAVEAAVEAGKAEVERVGTLTGALVIARPDPVIQRLFSGDIPVGTAFDR